MKPAPFAYVRAGSVDQALAVLAAEPDARPLAGGQSLIAMMNLRLLKPACLVDINRLSELAYIKDDGDAIAIGALTRHNEVMHAPLVAEHCPLLAEAYPNIAHHTVRNRGTIGGNLCQGDPASENPAVAVASGATMVLRSQDGAREVAAEEFFLGLYETAVRQGELLTEIRYPKKAAGEGTAFEEVSNRQGDFALAAIAVCLRVSNGAVDAARITAAAVGERPQRLGSAEGALTGRAPDAAAIAAAAEQAGGDVDPSTDYHADADYRRELVATLTRRCLERAAARAG